MVSLVNDLICMWNYTGWLPGIEGLTKRSENYGLLLCLLKPDRDRS